MKFWLGRSKGSLLLAFTLAALFLTASAGANERPSVPFKGIFTYTSELAADQGTCPVLRIQSAGSGHATQLGRFQIAQSQCLDPADPLAFTGGTLVATAANGDLQYGTYAGRFVPTATPGVFTVDGSFAITSGTGRMSGATGGGTATGTATFAGGTIVLEGEILRPR